MSEYILNSPNYIDPLYRPYYSDYSKSNLQFPYAIPSKYPMVDTRRFRRGNAFRSKHDGICPPGYFLGANNMCIPEEPESFGMFYTDAYSTEPLECSDKQPYNSRL